MQSWPGQALGFADLRRKSLAGRYNRYKFTLSFEKLVMTEDLTEVSRGARLGREERKSPSARYIFEFYAAPLEGVSPVVWILAVLRL